jgi:hypothetical protein
MLHWDNLSKNYMKIGTTCDVTGLLGPVGPHEQGPNETTGLPLRDK